MNQNRSSAESSEFSNQSEKTGLFGRDMLRITAGLVDSLVVANNYDVSENPTSQISIYQLNQIRSASKDLTVLAIDMADYFQLPLKDIYAQRLAELENRQSDSLDAINQDLLLVDTIGHTTNWKQLQRAQALHDQFYHQQVINWSHYKQFRHHIFHLVKLSGHISQAYENGDWDKVKQLYVADVLAFGVILANLISIKMDNFGLDFKSL